MLSRLLADLRLMASSSCCTCNNKGQRSVLCWVLSNSNAKNRVVSGVQKVAGKAIDLLLIKYIAKHEKT